MSDLLSVARAAAIAIHLVAAANAHSDPVPETGPPQAALSDMQAGRLLIRAGRLEDARKFLQQARPSGEEDRIERLFLLGWIEMRLGMPERAATRFEAVLARRPDLTRARLELAQAYFRSGRDDKARYHFELSLADEVPSSVEGAVEGFLRRIDARKRWALSLSAAMLPETRRSDRETVLIGGVPFRLSEDARASSGAGALVSAGVSFSPAIADNVRGVLAASAAAKFYERSDWNDVTGSGVVGLTRLFENGTASGGLRFGRRWIGGDGYNRSVGPWARTRLRLSSSTHLDLDVSAGYRTHDTRRDRDGWRVAVTPGLVHVLDGRTSVEVVPTFEAVGARKGYFRRRRFGFHMTISRAFEGGLLVSVSPGAHIRRYAAADPLFARKQVDRTVRLGIRVLHRSLRYGGFAPYIGYSFERNRSNIPIHESRSHGVLVGVSRRF